MAETKSTTKKPTSPTKKTTTTKKPATKKATSTSAKKTTTVKKTTTTRKPAAKKTTSTTKKPSTTKATPASTKKSTTVKKTTVAKKPAVKKPTPRKTSTSKTTAAKKPTSTTVKKTTTKKPSTTKATPKKTTSRSTKKPVAKKAPVKKAPAKASAKKTVPKETVAANKKKDVKKLTPSNAPRKEKKKKEKPKVKKTPKQIQDEIVSKEAVENVFEDKEQNNTGLGKRFYLLFSIVFYAGAFFYVNSAIYDNNDYVQSALFAFALLLVAFLLLYFNIHGMIIKFFKLPIDYLVEQARLEYRKDLIVEEETGKRRRIGRYRTVFMIILYIIVFLGLIGSRVYNGIIEEDRVIVIVTQALATGGIYLLILCAWQYIFNIIPGLLENSIDAKSGFILTLSAMILILYVFFMMFNIAFLEEVMIFILIIGFILLLGVNLNMIVGEFNIFRNLKNRKGKSKAVTRMVFLIFFSFHLYIMVYASIVAFSIYDQNHDTYVFGNAEYDLTLEDNVQFNGSTVHAVYNAAGFRINNVYYEDGREILDFYEHGAYVTEYYYQSGPPITEFYTSTGELIDQVTKNGETYPAYAGVFESQYFVYYQGTLKGVTVEQTQHGYSDLLYYSVITISSIGYGDIHPNTNYLLPQFWGAFLSIYGITFYALSIGYVSNIAFMGVTDTKESENDDQ